MTDQKLAARWYATPYLRKRIAEQVLHPEIATVLSVGVSSKEELRRILSQKWGCSLSAALLNEMLDLTGFSTVFDARFKLAQTPTSTPPSPRPSPQPPQVRQVDDNEEPVEFVNDPSQIPGAPMDETPIQREPLSEEEQELLDLAGDSDLPEYRIAVTEEDAARAASKPSNIIQL